MRKLFLLCILLIFAVACGTGETVSEEVIQTAIAQTQAANTQEEDDAKPEEPTLDVVAKKNTAQAKNQMTEEAKPTSTPYPPTNTPRPTNTPKPTNTPTEIPTSTPLPDPIILEGTGDAVVDVDKGDWAAIVHVTGNSAGRYFGIKNIDSNNEAIDILVNETDPYDGYVPMDFKEGDATVRFQVEATGDWRIEVIPLMAHFAEYYLDVPGVFEGTGDNVFMLVGDTPDLAHITGNSQSRYFGVYSYGRQSGMDILVNETDPYDGTVIVPNDTLIIEVTAKGDWRIEITAK